MAGLGTNEKRVHTSDVDCSSARATVRFNGPESFLGDSFSHLRYVLKDDDLYSFAGKHTKRIVEGVPDIVRLCE